MKLAWDVESATRLPASPSSVSREEHFVRFALEAQVRCLSAGKAVYAELVTDY
jgi:hypothetical protein